MQYAEGIVGLFADKIFWNMKSCREKPSKHEGSYASELGNSQYLFLAMDSGADKDAESCNADYYFRYLFLTFFFHDEFPLLLGISILLGLL